MNPGKLHVVQDDIESFIHVVLYHSLRYLDHTASRNLPNIMERIFDDYFIDGDGAYQGGREKHMLFHKMHSVLGEDFHFTNNPALTYWIDVSFEAVKQWHNYADPPRNRRPYPILADPVLPPPRAPPQEKNYNDLDLRDHQWLTQVWQRVLEALEWPLGDKAIDRLPSKQGSSAGKRSNDEDYDEDPTPKKKKTKSRDGKCGTSGSSSLRQSQTMDDA
jgi:hypothetical protein